VNHEKSSEERVWVTSSLKPSMQCQKVAEKAMQTLDVVKRTCKHVTKYHCLVVTLTLSILDIRPHLKVCVQACCPSLARHWYHWNAKQCRGEQPSWLWASQSLRV